MLELSYRCLARFELYRGRLQQHQPPRWRLHLWITARMEEIRAQRAEREAREQDRRDKERINWGKVGPAIMSAFAELADEHEASREPDDTAK